MFKKKNEPDVPGNSVVMDTSGLIDGRVVGIARAGFLPRRVIVPQFVVAELQQLADGTNSYKRGRARYGMDVVKELQEIPTVKVIIERQKFPNVEEVDDKLVELAKMLKAELYTTDFNLGKVAEIEGLKVLNVNSLAQSLRPVILPGENLELKVVQKGSERGQGVAYLDDGTMVVVENGAKLVGKKVEVEFSRTLQTVAGKMMFATLAKGPRSAPSKPKPPAQSSRPKPQKRVDNRRPRQARPVEPRRKPASSKPSPKPSQKRPLTPEEEALKVLRRR